MFYTFRQNNSGGRFDVDDDVNIYVVIEGDTLSEIVDKAEQVGIYFDGCADGSDCPCCGDRWYPAYGESDDVPMWYDTPYDLTPVARDKADTVIHYKNGTRAYLRSGDSWRF